MPLREGASEGVRRENFDECMASYRENGTIGTTRPRNAAHARKMCWAMALDQARKSGARIPKKPQTRRQRRRARRR